jgi:hypothetical protein
VLSSRLIWIRVLSTVEFPAPLTRSEANMNAGKDKDTQRSKADADLQREVLEGRKFTLEEAVARMAGPGAMKGESPVTRVRQAENEIGTWLRGHVTDSAGALLVVLHRRATGSELLLDNLGEPLVVLSGYCQRVLDSEYLLREVVRDADFEWGRVMGERPHFEKEGSPRHPDDPYTVESVRSTLAGLVEQLSIDEHKEKH